MLPRHERRRLEAIERQLHVDDPEFARRFTQTSLIARLVARLSLRTVLLAVAVLVAVLCLALGEGGGFALAGVLAMLLIAVRNWTLRSE